MPSLKKLSYILKLLSFAFKRNVLLYAAVFISTASVFIEMAAMSTLVPIFESISGESKGISEYITRVFIFFNLETTPSNLLTFFLLLLLVRVLSHTLGQTLTVLTGMRIQAQIGSAVFDRIMKLTSVEDLHKKSIGFYTSMAGDEASRASTLVIVTVQFVTTSILVLLYYIAIIKYSLAIGLALVGFLFCCGLAVIGLFYWSYRLGAYQIEQSRSASATFVDGINNLRTVRCHQAESYVANEYKRKIFEYTFTNFKIDQIGLLTRSIPIVLLITSVLFWLAFKDAGEATLDLAFLMTLIVYLMRFFPAVGQAVLFLLRLSSEAKSGKDVTSMIEPCEIGVVFGEKCAPVRKIELENVGFFYEGDDAEGFVFKNLNFSFEAGKTYAVVGKSGSGKSTLIDLLLMFSLPKSGKTKLNGIDSLDIGVTAIRERLLLVPQEPAIFNDTIYNNICMGGKFSRDELEQACKLACVDDVIQDLEGGFEAKLEYQGNNLSGGQRQRIALARALIRKPDVLILDESTSALDKVTQDVVVENIKKMYVDKIVIFVTHDITLASGLNEALDLQSV